jgi:hypothetical protein
MLDQRMRVDTVASEQYVECNQDVIFFYHFGIEIGYEWRISDLRDKVIIDEHLTNLYE